MSFNTDALKKLRGETNVSVMTCKKALDEAGGNFDKAREILKRESEAIAVKKSERETKAGVIDSYIHSNRKIGTLIELRSETDFVANTAEFRALAHDIAMQIAASSPQSVEELLEQESLKNPGLNIGEIIKGAIQKFGEKIEVVRFEKFSL